MLPRDFLGRWGPRKIDKTTWLTTNVNARTLHLSWERTRSSNFNAEKRALVGRICMELLARSHQFVEACRRAGLQLNDASAVYYGNFSRVHGLLLSAASRAEADHDGPSSPALIDLEEIVTRCLESTQDGSGRLGGVSAG